MGVATCTVRKHLEHAYRKLGRHQPAGGRVRCAARCSRPRSCATGSRRLRPRSGAAAKDSRKREWPRGRRARTKEKEVPDIFSWGNHAPRPTLLRLALHGGPHGRAPRRGPVRCHRARCRCARTRPGATHPRASRRPRCCSTGSASPSAPCTPTPRRRSRSASPSSGSPRSPCTGPSRHRCRAEPGLLRARGRRRGGLPGAAALLPRRCAASSRPTGPRAWPPLAPGPAKRLRRQGREAGRAWRPRRARAATATWTRPSTTPSRPAPGVWQPTPRRRDMLGAWIGSLRHAGGQEARRGRRPGRAHQQRLHHPVRGGEEPGRATPRPRAPRPRRQTALFFNSNVGDHGR